MRGADRAGCSTSCAARGTVIGVDADAGAVAATRRRGHAARLCAVEHMPFADAAFDLVTCLDVIEHTPDDRRTLRELRRVTRPAARSSSRSRPIRRCGRLMTSSTATTGATAGPSCAPPPRRRAGSTCATAISTRSCWDPPPWCGSRRRQQAGAERSGRSGARPDPGLAQRPAGMAAALRGRACCAAAPGCRSGSRSWPSSPTSPRPPMAGPRRRCTSLHRATASSDRCRP